MATKKTATKKKTAKKTATKKKAATKKKTAKQEAFEHATQAIMTILTESRAGTGMSIEDVQTALAEMPAKAEEVMAHLEDAGHVARAGNGLFLPAQDESGAYTWQSQAPATHPPPALAKQLAAQDASDEQPTASPPAEPNHPAATFAENLENPDLPWDSGPSQERPVHDYTPILQQMAASQAQMAETQSAIAKTLEALTAVVQSMATAAPAEPAPAPPQAAPQPPPPSMAPPMPPMPNTPPMPPMAAPQPPMPAAAPPPPSPGMPPQQAMPPMPPGFPPPAAGMPPPVPPPMGAPPNGMAPPAPPQADPQQPWPPANYR